MCRVVGFSITMRDVPTRSITAAIFLKVVCSKIRFDAWQNGGWSVGMATIEELREGRCKDDSLGCCYMVEIGSACMYGSKDVADVRAKAQASVKTSQVRASTNFNTNSDISSYSSPQPSPPADWRSVSFRFLKRCLSFASNTMRAKVSPCSPLCLS